MTEKVTNITSKQSTAWAHSEILVMFVVTCNAAWATASTGSLDICKKIWNNMTSEHYAIWIKRWLTYFVFERA